MKKILIALFSLLTINLPINAQMLDVDYNFIDTAFDGIQPINNKQINSTTSR